MVEYVRCRQPLPKIDKNIKVDLKAIYTVNHLIKHKGQHLVRPVDSQGEKLIH